MRSPTVRGEPGDSETEAGTILVVDDEAPIVDVLCMLLEDEGFDVVGETDPMHAVHVIQEERPALLLTDVMMPGMSGYELASLGQSIEPEMQVVFMSAVIDRAHRDHPFLAKPFDLGQVIDLVDAQLRVS